MAWKRKPSPSGHMKVNEEEWEELRELVQGIKTGTVDAHTIPVDLQFLSTNDGFYKLTCSECDRLEWGTPTMSLEWPVYVWVIPTEEEPEETDAWPAISNAGTEYPISFGDIIFHAKTHPEITISLLMDLAKTTWKVLNWTGPQVKQLLGLE